MTVAVKTRREKFTEVYQKNTWRGSESVSGTGSDLRQTAGSARRCRGFCGNWGSSR
jgi:hypothetical protein